MASRPTERPARSWREFLTIHFPSYVPYGFASHHVEFWDWIWAIRKGERPQPFVAVWARGGAKSTSAEIATALVGMRGMRRYVVYISETQDLADRHVASIASALESANVERAVNKYGASKGWRRERLRTRGGYTIDSLGLDTASRGIKVDADRPDFIVLDDIDARHDTAETVRKKIEIITQTVLPAGSTDCAVVGVQNLVHIGSIFAQLADGSADFLADRIVSGPHPALRNCKLEMRGNEILELAGEPTWQGQNLEVCRGFVKTWGPRAFLRECQHEVQQSDRTVFRRDWFEIVDVLPADLVRVRYWDLAATVPEPGKDPDWISGCGMGRAANGVVYIYDMRHDRLRPEAVEQLVAATAAEDDRLVPIWIEQEPGASGKLVIDHFRRRILSGYEVRGNPATGNKLQRAGALSAAAEAGNVKLLRGNWNKAFLDEAEIFPDGDHDDQIDSADGAYAKVTLNAGELLAQEARELLEKMKRGESVVIARKQQGAVAAVAATALASDVPVAAETANVDRVLPAVWAGAPLDLRGMTPTGLAYLERKVQELVNRALGDGDPNRAAALLPELSRVKDRRQRLE